MSVEQEFYDSIPVGLLAFNKNGDIELINENFYRFGIIDTGKFSSLLDVNIYQNKIFTEIDITSELEILKNGGVFEKEIKIQKRIDGSQITLLLKGSPKIVDGSFLGGTLVLEDIKISFELQKEKVVASNYFRNILSDLSDYYFITDTNGNIKYTPKSDDDKKYDFIFNKISRNIVELFGKGNPENIRKLYKELEKSNSSKSTKLSVSTTDKDLHFTAKFIPIFSNKDEIQFCIIFLTDETESIQSNSKHLEELYELQKYQQLTSGLVGALFSVTSNGNIKYWNEESKKLFGYSKSEVFDKKISRILPQFDQFYFDSLKSELRENNVWDSEIKVDDNSNFNTLNIKAQLIDFEGEEKIVFHCTDVSDRAYSESELKRSEQKYRSIVNNTLEFICSIDLYGNVTFVNPYFIKEFGYTEKEFFDMRIYNLIDPEYVELNGFSIDDCVKQKIESKELTLIKKNGEKVEVLANFSTVQNMNGEPEYINAVLTDITSKKNAEKDLLLIQSVFEASHDGIAVIQNKKIILPNSKLAELFNYKSKEDLIDKDFIDLVAIEDSMIINQFMDRIALGETAPDPCEFTGIASDGSENILEITFSYYETSGLTYLVAVLRDISSEKSAQKTIEESEERYRNITANIDEFLWTAEKIEDKLKTVFYTEAVSKITEYSANDFIDNPNLWYRIIHPNDLLDMIKRLKMLYRDPAADSGEIEYRILTSSGKIVWIKNRINVIRDSKGDINKIFGSVRDITNNKRAEEKLKESTANLKELNDTKDRFISIISHDLRTPFSSILGFTDLLISEPEMESEKRMQYVNFIQESSKNMLSLVNSLLDWTRLQTGRVNFEPQRLNIRYIISNTIQMLSGASLKKDIELISEVSEDIFVHADENLILQVFSNLISNAIKFTDEGGKIWITAEPDLSTNQVRFIVKDNGNGIRKEDIVKLFTVDTKFTTNGTAGEKGSGLGLSLCHEIVHKHGGKIWVESEIGNGSEFIFTIPVSSTQILLVDDITADRLLYTKLLKSIIPNYTVIEAADGKEALSAIKQYSPALVITDHVMPVMTGSELVQQINLQETGHKPPIIVLSGDVNRSVADTYSELGVEFIFSKPVNLANFKFAVEKSLKQAIYK